MTGPILVMAGGTGGHVFPALAVAEALRARQLDVVWMGTARGMEARIVPEAGIPMEWISIAGLRGKTLLSRLAGPFRVAWAVAQALGIVARLKPAAVLGMGGYAAGPGGIAAWLLRRPLVIHEQNAVAGVTNRVLSRFARRVLAAFPGAFPANVPVEVVGNPVRPAIAALPAPGQRFAGRQGRVRVLVLGGSQGALALNRTVPAALARLPAEARPEVRHQAGRATIDQAREAYRAAGVDAEVVEFIGDMAEAYGWADLAICRAGALTVSELAAAGLGAVLVPFPAAVDDHQTLNAGFLVDAGAAVLVQEADISVDSLAGLLGQLLGDRRRLAEMGGRARSVARPDALETIERACLEAGGLAGEGAR